MQVPQTGETQKERLAAELLRLKPDVTAADRQAAIQKFQLTKATVSNYLNGKVEDNDTAVSFIEFFKHRIAKREKVIA